jgi:magnesium-transporting ATPase (P-type)
LLSQDHRKDIEKEVCFAGLVGLQDPPREGVPAAVAACKKAGINVRTPREPLRLSDLAQVHMLTGDHPVTAGAIARQIGLLEGGAEEALQDVLPAPTFDRIPDEELLARPHLPIVPSHYTRLSVRSSRVGCVCGEETCGSKY